MNKPIIIPRRLQAALNTAHKCFDIEPRALLNRGRRPPIAHARQAVWAALYEACDTSYPELARLFQRDNQTVLYGVRVARGRAVEDAEYRAVIELIVREVRAA